MNDKELIELAAKAAGHNYKPKSGCIVVDGIPGVWNPLEDDGDALRLAVKLRVQVTPGAFRNNEFAAYACGGIVTREYKAPTIKDEFAATRRAIVRAAAEIGRNM